MESGKFNLFVICVYILYDTQFMLSIIYKFVHRHVYVYVYMHNFGFMLFLSATFSLEHNAWKRYDSAAYGDKPGKEGHLQINALCYIMCLHTS